MYSGDTKECQTFLKYAQVAKLFICEATLQDGMEEDAAMKHHMTTSQALGIAKRFGIWRTILTHFSPRYQKKGEILPSMQDVKALVAYDHTRVSMSHLEWAYQITPLYD